MEYVSILCLSLVNVWSMSAYSASTSMSVSIPNLRVHPKVHKPRLPNGDPPTRPLVGATNGPTLRSGDVVARILDCVSMAREKQSEVLSTEELLGEIEDISDEVTRNSRRAVAGSIDVKALTHPLTSRNQRKCVPRQSLLVQ